jgi:hypothetical protein
MRHTSVLLLATALLFAAQATAHAQVPDSILALRAGGQTLFRLNVDGGALFRGNYDGGTSSGGIAEEGAGTRMLWYPQKGAFRAGYINGTQWDDANIGYFTIAAGQNVRASGDGSTAFGVRSTAAGSSTFAVGEDNSATGAASVAMGYHAHTNARQGSFVFGDRSTVDTIRVGVNHSANWRVSGGFRIFTASNLSTGVTFQSGASVSNWGQSNAVISTSTGAYLHANGTWANASDVRRKHGFEDVSGDHVLTRLRELPIRSWSYRVESETVRHIGPTAQDFHAAFGLGADTTAIGTVDADGVALLGVQTLDRRTLEQAEELRVLRSENEQLRAIQTEQAARLDVLQQRLDRLEARAAGTKTDDR